MRIATFSLAPIFPKHVHGGSQKILRQILSHLGAAGHIVRVVCVSRADNMAEFELSHNVRVTPCLRLKPTYPEPYYTAPFHLASMVATVKELVQWSDVFYIHDAEMPFHDLYSDRPTVTSFRDFVYPDTLVGAFGFRRDRLILNSPYAAGCVRDAFSAILPGISDRIAVVKNGIDLEHYRPRSNSPGPKLRKLLGHLPNATHTIIYPHRPDRRKGMVEALNLLAAVAPRLARVGRSIRLIMPVWVDSEIAAGSDHEYQTLYRQVTSLAADLGVRSSVAFHPWVPQELMPEYYSMADATICLGSFVETFGNAHVESVACGTPVLVSNVAAQASLLPDDLVNRVPFGDTVAATDHLEQILLGGQSLNANVARDALREEFDFEQMLGQYEEIITSTRLSRPLSVQIPPPLQPETRVSMPMWCRFDGIGIYNDYQYGRESSEEMLRLARITRTPIAIDKLYSHGFELQTIERGLETGMLVRGDL